MSESRDFGVDVVLTLTTGRKVCPSVATMVEMVQWLARRETPYLVADSTVMFADADRAIDACHAQHPWLRQYGRDSVPNDPGEGVHWLTTIAVTHGLRLTLTRP